MTETSLREESVFARALEVSSADRPAFLDDACAADLALRADVEALLRADARSGDLLDLPDRLTAETAASDQEGPHTVIGAYRLLEVIGEGGFGMVFRAEQESPVRRQVAVKLVKPGMDSREVLARFEAERQALALVDHPNIARVLDGGATTSGRPYFVMELVRGVPITDFCDRNRLTPRQRLGLFVDVCRAVQHAHTKGVIHRDLKPSNVLVTVHDATPVVKVIDFGVAKAVGPGLADRTRVTGFAQMVGTPLYMSPEQAGLSGLDVDTRSDIYALGVLLYELLTGTTPFDRERFGRAPYDEIRRIIREEEPARPSSRLSTLGAAAETVSANRGSEPRKLTATVRGELDWMVMKALEKDRDRRYESASAFAADVERFLTHKPVEACPPSATYRVRKFVRRNRGAVSAAAVIALILIGGGVGTTFGLVRAERARAAEARERATAERERDQKEQARRQAVAHLGKAREAVDRMLTRVSEERLPAVPQTEPLRRQLLRDALSLFEDLAENGGDDPEVRAETALAYARLGNICRLLGADTEAEDRFRRALTLLDPFAATPDCEPRLRVARVDCHRQLGWLLIARGRRQDAAISQRRALGLAEELVADFPDVPRYRHEVAICCANLGATVCRNRPDEAAGLYRRSIRLAEAEPGNPDCLALAYLSQGHLFHQTNQRREAEEALRKSLAVFGTLPQGRQDSLGARQNVCATLTCLGAVLAAAGQFVDAERTYRAASTLAERQAADAPRVPYYTNQLASCRLGLGGVLRSTGQFREAETEYRAVLRLLEQVTADYPDALDWRFSLPAGGPDLAGVLLVVKDPPAGPADGVSPHRTTDEPPGLGHHTRRANAFLELGRLFAAERRPADAEDAFRSAFGVYRDLQSKYADQPEHREVLAVALSRGALTLKDAGRFEDAARVGRWAQEAYAKLVAQNPGDREYQERLAGEHFRLGAISRLLARPADAEKAYREAATHYARLARDGPRQDDFRFALASTHNNLGRQLASLGRPLDAVREYRRSLELYGELPADFHKKPAYQRNVGFTRHNLAWLLATAADPKVRDAGEAVVLARQAAEAVPDTGLVWTTLGVAHYRAGDPKAAIAALEKSMELRNGGDSFDWFFLTMIRWHMGERSLAREWFDRAVVWMDKNQPQDDELRRFRVEAAGVLGIEMK